MAYCWHRYYLTDTVILIILIVIVICNMLTGLEVLLSSSSVQKYDHGDNDDVDSKCKVVNCAECS